MTDSTPAWSQDVEFVDQAIERAAAEFRAIGGCGVDPECDADTPGICFLTRRLTAEVIAQIPDGAEDEILHWLIWGQLAGTVMGFMDESAASASEAVSEMTGIAHAVIIAQGGEDDAMQVITEREIALYAEHPPEPRLRSVE